MDPLYVMGLVAFLFLIVSWLAGWNEPVTLKEWTKWNR